MQGPASYAVAKALLKGNALTMTWQPIFPGESRTDPEAVHAEEHPVWQGHDRKGMGSQRFGTKQLFQGFSHDE
eukprot:1874942-Ditylum_brightwellii.AAC.1